jgi:hypothetical protein
MREVRPPSHDLLVGPDGTRCGVQPTWGETGFSQDPGFSRFALRTMRKMGGRGGSTQVSPGDHGRFWDEATAV